MAQKSGGAFYSVDGQKTELLENLTTVPHRSLAPTTLLASCASGVSEVCDALRAPHPFQEQPLRSSPFDTERKIEAASHSWFTDLSKPLRIMTHHLHEITLSFVIKCYPSV